MMGASVLVRMNGSSGWGMARALSRLTLQLTPIQPRTVTASRPRRMLVTSLVALALLVLAGLGMARVEKAGTPQQGLDGAFLLL